jgi:3-deoxy-D-manno-octulosonate 8-phosphate phosphatase (KDO 8-P phosphatase)
VKQLSLQERCARIELLVMDVDGVLTDGSIIYDDHGVELKAFHVRDGSGLKIWQQAGKRAAILSGRSSKTVAVRAAELGIQAVLQGTADKLPAYLQLVSAQGLQLEQVCYVGDDLPDLPVLRHGGLAVAVADACPEVIGEAHFVTRAPGGRGAVRETIELILHSQGLWQQAVALFCDRTERLPKS